MSQIQAGQMMGPYRLINEIGKGGMAIVWKAYHAAMDRYVAIKMLPFQFALREEFLVRFRQEAKVIAKLEHPHILPVYDYGENEEMPYLVMRLLEAGTLTERIQSGALGLAEIDRIFTQLADALAYAHEKGVIHRDIKPSNAMLDTRGEIFLTDFGIAKIVEGAVAHTATGTITGTPEYMSPEQAQGLKIDQRTDIYSLGVVLYEMLTGQVPYHAETPIAVILKKIQDPLPPPSVVNPDIPDPLEPVLLKALTKDPADRFASMNDFLAAWKKAVADCTPTQQMQQEAVLSAKKEESPKRPSYPGVSEGTVSPVSAGTVGNPVGEKAPQGEKAAPQPKKSSAVPWAWVFGGAGLLIILCGVLGGGAVLFRAMRNRALPTRTQYILAAAQIPTDTVDAPTMAASLGESPLPSETAGVQSLPPTQTATSLPIDIPVPSHTPQPTGRQTTILDAKGLAMVLVPAGAFPMGSNLEEIMAFCPGRDQGRQCKSDNYSNEAGVHTVILDDYYIDAYEVTNQAYAACVQANGCDAPTDISLNSQDYYYGNPTFDNYPVVHVSWYDAQKYCNWRGGRLPTEAEWEKAAKGTEQQFFPWGNDFTGKAANVCDVNCTYDTSNNSIDDGYPYTSPVGIFVDGKSPYGAFDMAGNVWEWVADWYNKAYYATQLENALNPTGPETGDGRVLRGGSWISNIFNLRTTLRLTYKPDFQAAQIGFRCAREP